MIKKKATKTPKKKVIKKETIKEEDSEGEDTKPKKKREKRFPYTQTTHNRIRKEMMELQKLTKFYRSEIGVAITKGGIQGKFFESEVDDKTIDPKVEAEYPNEEYIKSIHSFEGLLNTLETKSHSIIMDGRKILEEVRKNTTIKD